MIAGSARKIDIARCSLLPRNDDQLSPGKLRYDRVICDRVEEISLFWRASALTFLLKERCYGFRSRIMISSDFLLEIKKKREKKSELLDVVRECKIGFEVFDITNFII